jgi:hypothetical protein
MPLPYLDYFQREICCPKKLAEIFGSEILDVVSALLTSVKGVKA